MTHRGRSHDAQAISRATVICRKQVRNLLRSEGKPYVAEVGAFEGVAAILVGGGPTLDEVGHLLPEASEHALLIGCNTSLGCIHHHGAQADYVVTMEALPVLSVMDDLLPGEQLIASLGAHEDAFDAAHGWFISASGHTTRLGLDLGVEMVGHGGRATLAAFSLARLWACDPIIIVGMHGLVESGECYAEGASWRGWVADADTKSRMVTYTGRPDRDELHDTLGVIRAPRKEPLVEVPTWSGERGFSVTALVGQSIWLEEQATLGWPNKLVFGDPDGVALEGWEHAPLDEHVIRRGYAKRETPDFEPVDTTAALANLRTEHETATAMLDAFETSSLLPTESMGNGMHMVAGLAMSDLIRARQPGPLPIATRQRLCIEAERRAAREMAEMLEGK